MRLVTGTLLAITLLLSVTRPALAVLHVAQPPMTQFSPNLDVYPQNFSIAIDARSRVYIGNMEGVLIFDGEYWQQVEMPNRDIVRWLEYDGNSTIYVGGYETFGYLEENELGVVSYRDLTHRFAAELGDTRFGDIWHIAAGPQGVFFVGLAHLFHYDPATGQTAYWEHKGSFGPIAYFEGRALLQWRGEGIRSYADGAWSPVDGPDLSTAFITALVPLDDELIVVASDVVWHRYDGARFHPMPETATLVHRPSMTWGFAIGDHQLGLTTQVGDIVFYDLETRRAAVVKVADGFLPAARLAPDGSILVVHDLGFHAVQWPARWSRVDGTQQLAGTVHSLHSHADKTWVMTSSGAFSARRDGTRFERLAWTDYEAWDMLPLDDGTILFADSYEIKLIRDGVVDAVIDRSTTARVFKQSAFDPRVVYAGTEFGIQVLRLTDAGWKTVLRDDTMDKLRVTEIIERSPTEIWVGSDRGGIRKLEFERGDPWSFTQHRMADAEGMDYGDLSAGAHLYEFDGELVATTGQGIYRWLGERFVKDSLTGFDERLVPNRTVQLLKHGEIYWAYYFNRIWRYDGAWSEENLTGLRTGAIALVALLDEQPVVGSLGALMAFDARVPRATPRSGGVAMAGAFAFGGVGAETRTRRLPLDRISLGSDNERLTVRFAVPDFVEPDDVVYRTRLSPIEGVMSPWSRDNQQTLLDLAPGTYEFRVEARNSQGEVSRTSLPITVVPRWFETALFRLTLALLGVVLGVILIVFLSARRTRLLSAERDRLESMVTERTRALESANKQLDKMAHLDGLTQIPNRRRLDTYLEDVRLQCVERNRVMSVALIDIDYFKRFNDTHGHPAGDALLVDLAKLLSRNLRRAEDLVARYGGEEFLVVLPGADEAAALQVVEDMRAAVAASALGVTISAGLHVTFPSEHSTESQMVEAADKALYAAKDGGRNQVCIG